MLYNLYFGPCLFLFLCISILHLLADFSTEPEILFQNLTLSPFIPVTFLSLKNKSLSSKKSSSLIVLSEKGRSSISKIFDVKHAIFSTVDNASIRNIEELHLHDS